MLFSNDRVAAEINERFEPVWESVRPVPLVQIDFGTGQEVTRTLHGNIATYVCNAEGQVLDVLPGIYEPKMYLTQLQQLSALNRKVTSADTEGRLRAYHQQQSAALARKSRDTVTNEDPEDKSKGDFEFSKGSFESPIEDAVQIPEIDPSLQGNLEQDTQANESTRRRRIHDYLARQGLVTHTSMTRWLYREVLDADLDDPRLGLELKPFP